MISLFAQASRFVKFARRGAFALALTAPAATGWAQDHVASYEIGHITHFEAQPPESWTGAWIHTPSITLRDGPSPQGGSSFSLNGDYDSPGEIEIAISSTRSRIRIPDAFADQSEPPFGNSFTISRRSLGGRLHALTQSLNALDLIRLRAICGLLASDESIAAIAGRLTEDRSRTGERYHSFWSGSATISEAQRIGSRCYVQVDRAMRAAEEGIVGQAQSLLAGLGLYEGAIDGAAGPQTRRALSDFARSYGTAELSPLELVAFFDAAARQSGPNAMSPQEAESLSEDYWKLRGELGDLRSALAACDDGAAQQTGAACAGNGDTPAALEEELSELRAEVETLRAAAEVEADETAEDSAEAQVPLAEHEALKRQLDAANAALADLRESTASAAELAETERQLDAANSALADLRASTASAAELAETERQLAAANKTLVDMYGQLDILRPRADQLSSELSASLAKTATLERQVAALNSAISDQRETSVPLSEHRQTLSELEAGLQALAALRTRMENEFVPRATFEDVTRQLQAANAALADLRNTLETRYVPLADHAEQQRQTAALNETVALLTERAERFKSLWLDAQRVNEVFIDECRMFPACAAALELD